MKYRSTMFLTLSKFKSKLIKHMFYGLAEKSIELREGEKLFSTRMQKAFFDNLGHRPFRGSQHINGAGYLLEPDTGCVRIVVDVATTYGSGKTINKSIGTARAADINDAEKLVEAMNEPPTLQRANRAIEAVHPVAANAGNIAVYATAAGCALAAVIM